MDAERCKSAALGGLCIVLVHVRRVLGRYIHARTAYIIPTDDDGALWNGVANSRLRCKRAEGIGLPVQSSKVLRNIVDLRTRGLTTDLRRRRRCIVERDQPNTISEATSLSECLTYR